MTFRAFCSGLATIVLMTSVAAAQCTDKKTTASGEGKASGCCKSKATAASCADKSACCKTTMETAAGKITIPAMAYKVGDETVACPGKAGELAKDDKAKIKYVVAGKEYATQTEAADAYAAALDGFLNEMTTVRYSVGDKTMDCPMSAAGAAKEANAQVRYQMASFVFNDKEKAEKAATEAKVAAEKVSMKWKVGDKDFCCSSMAGQAAKKSDQKVKYIVGEQTLECSQEASVALAKARILAAANVLGKAADSTTKLASAGG